MFCVAMATEAVEAALVLEAVEAALVLEAVEAIVADFVEEICSDGIITLYISCATSLQYFCSGISLLFTTPIILSILKL